MPPDPLSYNMSDVNPHLTRCEPLPYITAGSTPVKRFLKCRLGCSLKSRIYGRALVPLRKVPTYQYIRNDGSSSGSAILQNMLQKQSSSHHLKQHLGMVYINRKGGTRLA